MKVTPMLLSITLLGMVAVPVMGQTFMCRVCFKGPSGMPAFLLFVVCSSFLKLNPPLPLGPSNSCSQHLPTAGSSFVVPFGC